MRLTLLAACALTGAVFAFDTALDGTLGVDTPSVDTPRVDTPPVGTTPAAKAVPALDKIAVIGASLSAGFGMDGNPDQTATSKLRLAHVIDASLLVPHQPIEDRATAMFFLSPDGTASRTLKKMRDWKPSTIVALDYLFWFGYGEKQSTSHDAKERAGEIEAKRVADLDAALKDLGTFTCTIVLGDLPDMRAATLVRPDPMIVPAMVPTPETLKTLNEHIVAFAKEHPNVVVVPLAAVTAQLQADDEIQVRGYTWPKGSAKVLMQKDRLHPTLEGACLVWILSVDTWLKSEKELPASAFDLDPSKLAARVNDHKAAPAGKAEDKHEKKTSGF